MTSSRLPPSGEGTRTTRQVLSKRQAATVDALLEAGLEALHDVGWDGLSLRDVAGRAGVTHTTAYTYFTSKEHLVAELNRRLLRALPDPAPATGAPLAARLTEALRGPTDLFVDDPELASAVFASMVARDPDIQRLRDAIGAELLRRLEVAAGPDHEPQVVWATLLIYSGAMLQAGMAYFGFAEVVARVEAVVAMAGSGVARAPGGSRRGRPG